MKKNSIYKTLGYLCGTLVLLVINFHHSCGQTYCTETGTERYAGEQDGFRYELWNQNAQGTACMTLGSGALFSGEWSDIQNYLARRGLGYNQTQQHQEIGTFYSTYTCSYNPSSASGNSYLAIYGWTVDPLIEYYIIEDWRNWIPSMDANATKKGSVEVNGSIYDIYENTRVNQPSIIGTTTFQQYFSIRRSKRDSGTINISDHFNKWESLGMDMGKMYEVSFVVEGYQSSGTFDFTDLDVFVSSDPIKISDKSDVSSPVSIYTAPDSGSFFVRLNESVKNANIKVYDISGKVIFSQGNVNSSPLQVSGLKTGIYLVKVATNGVNYTAKYMVK